MTTTPMIAAHVSPGRNLNSILRDGLVSNANFGNYSGYYQALEGVYASFEVNVLRDHLVARNAFDDYVLVFIDVGEDAVVDEDILDILMSKSTSHMMAIEIQPEPNPDEVLQAQECFLMLLEAEGENLDAEDNARDFAEAWIKENIYGESVDPLWWPVAKQELIERYPNIKHPQFGSEWSVRIPNDVGFKGDSQIVCILHVVDNNAKIVYNTPTMIESIWQAELFLQRMDIDEVDGDFEQEIQMREFHWPSI